MCILVLVGSLCVYCYVGGLLVCCFGLVLGYWLLMFFGLGWIDHLAAYAVWVGVGSLFCFWICWG